MPESGKYVSIVFLLVGMFLLAGCDPYFSRTIAFDEKNDFENRQAVDDLIRESIIEVLPDADVEKIEVDHWPVFLIRINDKISFEVSLSYRDSSYYIVILSRIKTQAAEDILNRIQKKLIDKDINMKSVPFSRTLW